MVNISLLHDQTRSISLPKMLLQICHDTLFPLHQSCLTLLPDMRTIVGVCQGFTGLSVFYVIILVSSRLGQLGLREVFVSCCDVRRYILAIRTCSRRDPRPFSLGLCFSYLTYLVDLNSSFSFFLPSSSFHQSPACLPRVLWSACALVMIAV